MKNKKGMLIAECGPFAILQVSADWFHVIDKNQVKPLLVCRTIEEAKRYIISQY